MLRNLRLRSSCFAALAMLISSLAAPALADAYQVAVSWQPLVSQGGGIAGYHVYVRQGVDYQGVSPVDVGLPVAGSDGALNVQVSGIPMGPTSWFMVRSYDSSRIEGPRSNELALDYATAAAVVDSDGDGLVDADEDVNLNATVDAGESDPNSADTDGDGLDDGRESALGTSATDSDSDDDGLSDFDEVEVIGTNPLLADSDGDGELDGVEVAAGTDPTDANSNSTSADPVCGNGILEAGEECDDGPANSDADPNACQLDCSLHPACGDATDDGILTATDAFQILRAAVELGQCPLSNCDTDGDGTLSPSDGLRVVRAAVGQDVSLQCGLLVTLALDASVPTGKTRAVVDYRDTGSTFVGEAGEVRCESLLPESASVDFFNDTVGGRLELTVVATEDVAGGLDVARCRFYARQQAPAQDTFVVDVTDYPVVPVTGTVPSMRVYY